MKSTKQKKSSDIIKEFLDYLQDCQVKNTFAYDSVNEQDKLSQDLLHKLELEDLSPKERNKVARELQLNRKDRRYYKDLVEETEPIKRYVADNKKALDTLKMVLGEVRKVEKFHETRTYIPKSEKFKNNALNKKSKKETICEK